MGRHPPKCPTWDAAALGVQHQCPKANTLTPNPLSVKSLPPPGMLNAPHSSRVNSGSISQTQRQTQRGGANLGARGAVRLSLAVLPVCFGDC